MSPGRAEAHAEDARSALTRRLARSYLRPDIAPSHRACAVHSRESTSVPSRLSSAAPPLSAEPTGLNPPTPVSGEPQLLRLQLVGLLVDRAARGVTDGIHVSELAVAGARIGVPERDFLHVIHDLGRRGMCRSVDGLPVSLDSAVVPTRLAAYAIKQMCRGFTYVDFCSVDCVIFDADSLRELQDVTLEIEASHSPVDRVRLRLSRVEAFLQYLVRCEERWIVEARRRELGQEWQHQFVEADIAPAVLKDAEVALRSAERRFGRPAIPIQDGVDSATLPTDGATFAGEIVNVWPDKDYVFIRGEDGTDWVFV